jgi:hypothetical protein
LGIASASRFDWIGRFDCLHYFSKGRGTRNDSATRPQGISETLSNDFGLAIRRSRKGDGIGIDCQNEDHGPAIRFHIGMMRWRSAENTDEMRRCLGGFIKSVDNTQPRSGGNGNGSQQPLLR